MGLVILVLEETAKTALIYASKTKRRHITRWRRSANTAAAPPPRYPREKMKLYKFKDLSDESKHSHFLQIVLNNTIWCAKPDSLNDDEEFNFKINYEPSLHTANLLSKVIEKYRTTNHIDPRLSASMALQHNTLENRAAPIIDDLILKCRKSIGITSFSLTNTDDHLWKEYGGNGNGVSIEINIPDSLVGQSYHHVKYVPEKVFHVDSFLEAVLFNKAFEMILLTKTKAKWEQEEEIRFIGNRQEVNLIINGYISEITFGPNVSTSSLNQLMAAIANHCNTNQIRVVKL